MNHAQVNVYSRLVVGASYAREAGQWIFFRFQGLENRCDSAILPLNFRSVPGNHMIDFHILYDFASDGLSGSPQAVAKLIMVAILVARLAVRVF